MFVFQSLLVLRTKLIDYFVSSITCNEQSLRNCYMHSKTATLVLIRAPLLKDHKMASDKVKPRGSCLAALTLMRLANDGSMIKSANLAKGKVVSLHSDLDLLNFVASVFSLSPLLPRSNAMIQSPGQSFFLDVLRMRGECRRFSP